MANYTIVSVTRNLVDQSVMMVVVVSETWGNTEYNGTLATADLAGLTLGQQKTALLVACKNTRDADPRVGGGRQAVAGITGSGVI